MLKIFAFVGYIAHLQISKSLLRYNVLVPTGQLNCLTLHSELWQLLLCYKPGKRRCKGIFFRECASICQERVSSTVRLLSVIVTCVKVLAFPNPTFDVKIKSIQMGFGAKIRLTMANNCAKLF